MANKPWNLKIETFKELYRFMDSEAICLRWRRESSAFLKEDLFTLESHILSFSVSREKEQLRKLLYIRAEMNHSGVPFT